MPVNRAKRSKLSKRTLNEVLPVENVNKNPQSFLEIIPMQKEIFPSYKLQGQVSFGTKGR